MKHLHTISALVFLLIYLVKTVLLLINKHSALDTFKARTKVVEMIVSAGFLVSGIWLFIQVGAIKNIQIIKLVLVFAAIPLAVIGFKNANKALASLSFIFILAAYGMAEAGKKQPYPSVILAENETVGLDTGEKIYKANCVMCHGAAGDKQFNGASNLKLSQLANDEIIQVVTNGRKAMPKYGKALSKEEINALAEYLPKLRQ
jgi:mono/diheme cytochrome c family protein